MAAHYAENASDPDEERREAINIWLRSGPAPKPESEAIRTHFSDFRSAGFGRMDALHLAWAIELGADVLLTTDDRFISAARRLGNMIIVRVQNPIAFVQEHRP